MRVCRGAGPVLAVALASAGVAWGLPDASQELVTFGGDSDYPWKLVNDPVMGGVSTSTWKVDRKSGLADWVGNCSIVPSLEAPGFCNAETWGRFLPKFADVSEYTHLIIVARSLMPYDGFKFAFAADTITPQFTSFKADFTLPSDGEWHEVAIPWSAFSNDWSSYTGEPIVPCSEEHPEVCPTAHNLADISQVGLWTEGVEGEFHFQVSWIGAGNATEEETEAFDGNYSDPNHPGCARYIVVNDATTAEVYGADAAGGEGVPCDGSTDVAWGPLAAVLDGSQITVDFSPKGGPSNLMGEYNTSLPGITWEDGNGWVKLAQHRGVTTGRLPPRESWDSVCSGPVASPLRFGVDAYTAQGVGLPFNPPANESLAEAVCCDATYAGYPEPRGLFAQPDVNLFRSLDSSGLTTFYDSVCGMPLFTAPQGRSFSAWALESAEHGWPSFRPEEVLPDAVRVLDDGRTVVSACGTRLGTLEPDDKGDRYCLDTVCIAGEEPTA